MIGSLVDADGLTVAQAANVAGCAGGEYFAATPFNEDNHLRPEPAGTF